MYGKSSSVANDLSIVFSLFCQWGVFLLLMLSSLVSYGEVRNKYAMELLKTGESYSLKNESQICERINCDSLPSDAYVPYTYVPEKIQEEDYANCKTVTYTFKTYKTHKLTMAVDLPGASYEPPYPFVIYVHGGGWTTGNLGIFKDQSTYAASRGIAGVRVSYSLVGQEGHFDLGMQELDDAWNFIRRHVSQWKLDTTRFGYAGVSAGAPLAALKAMKHEGCKLFVGCEGIYDFQHNLEGSFNGSSPYMKNYPTRESRSVISAINNIPESDVPACALFHGSADFTISYLQSVAFADAIGNHGGQVQLCIYPNYVHSFLNRGHSNVYEDVCMEMYRFASRVLQESQSLNRQPNKVEHFRIYPNPVREGRLNLETNVCGDAHIAVFSLENKLVWLSETILEAGVNNIILPSLPHGCYIIKVMELQTGNVFAGKLYVQ